MAVVLWLAAWKTNAQQPDSTEARARSLLVHRTIPYPVAAMEAGIEGTVRVEIIIDRLCTITGKRVINSLGYGLDEAALNIIDREFQEALTRALMPCPPDTLVLPINFTLE